MIDEQPPGEPVFRPLRIVHCFRSPVGGIFRHVRDLATAQSAAGHQVGIICDSSTGGAYEDHLFDGIRDKLALGVHRIAMQRHIGPGDMFAGIKTFAVIKKLRPDILHGHGAKGGVYSRIFGSVLRVSRSRVARFYSPHGGSLHFGKDELEGKLVFAAERMMEPLTDAIIFVSQYERDSYIQKLGRPKCPSVVIYNGLTDADFVKVEAPAEAADFLYVGMMRDLKGPDMFIGAIAEAERLAKRRLSAVLVGDGADKPRYIRLAGELGLADRVQFRDPMPVREAFRLGRTVVVPSRAEAMPYIVLETLAAAKPILATHVGGIPEILAMEPSALVAPTVKALAEKMAEIAADPSAYRRGMPNHEDIRRRFGAAAMAQAIEEVYRAALVERV
ncbi:glycosyltransferase family 1 protein [Phyllobacterium salinisoli]|uniref:Glycosyltransferase family 1 protein n=1 Tax=Phyllobacterium salinisoli TaxID=1899321 RepID=A0A368K1Q2_9HYPH|nr:glycosyltransferase family 4 protein [Phyllobacterium salinisoli]RCS23094.1 glycosyltransferase family 1 protein [Phyllobacterium salinisoli]